MEKTIWFCARCGRGVGDRPVYDLCGQCKDKLRKKLFELREMSFSLQNEYKQAYGASSIEEAYVNRHYGGAGSKVCYFCDECGKELTKPPPAKARFNIGFGEYDRREGFRCESCQFEHEEHQKRLRREEQEERRRSSRWF